MTNLGDQGSSRAKQDETVWVLLNHVKADKLEVHRQFIFNVLMPAVQKVAPGLIHTVRFLEPTQPNDDGTYTSVWLMDPVVDGVDYSYVTLLTQAYGAEQAADYMKLVDEYEVSLQTNYELRQSSW
jgi:hypothetical protein